MQPLFSSPSSHSFINLIYKLKAISVDHNLSDRLDAHFNGWIDNGSGDIKAFFKVLCELVYDFHDDQIYEAIACLSLYSGGRSGFIIPHSDAYSRLLDRLPGGSTFTTADWASNRGWDHRYILSELEIRKKIPNSFQYTLEMYLGKSMTKHSWCFILDLAKSANAFGCKSQDGKITFYFENEVDEVLMRLS